MIFRSGAENLSGTLYRIIRAAHSQGKKGINANLTNIFLINRYNTGFLLGEFGPARKIFTSSRQDDA